MCLGALGSLGYPKVTLFYIINCQKGSLDCSPSYLSKYLQCSFAPKTIDRLLGYMMKIFQSIPMHVQLMMALMNCHSFKFWDQMEQLLMTLEYLLVFSIVHLNSHQMNSRIANFGFLTWFLEVNMVMLDPKSTFLVYVLNKTTKF